MHLLQVLQLPPTFDLSAKQKATVSYTAHIAQKRPHLLGSVFGGAELFKSNLARASLTGAHAHAQAASLLSNEDAIKYLTR